MNLNRKLLALLGLASFAAFVFLLYGLGPGKHDELVTIVPESAILLDANANSSSGASQMDIGGGWRGGPEVEQLPNCSATPPGLKGQLAMDLRMPSTEELEREHSGLELGGHWQPKECVARSRAAIIVPYRDREEHLRGFLHHLHGVLQSQQLDYAVIVVEQADNLTFNRGRLINVGFLEAQKLYGWQCFVFHDIDALPENDLNIYSCPEQANVAKHMTVGFEKNGYKLFYEDYFSGAIILGAELFSEANGFSNDYWGWGGEDDDFYARLKLIGGNITRNPPEIARYKQFPHNRDQGNPVNPCRFELLRHTKARQPVDGLNSLRYRLKSIELNRLFTHVKVDLLEEEFTGWTKIAKTIAKNC